MAKVFEWTKNDCDTCLHHHFDLDGYEYCEYPKPRECRYVRFTIMHRFIIIALLFVCVPFVICIMR